MKLKIILLSLIFLTSKVSYGAVLTWSSSLFNNDTQISNLGTQLSGVNMGGASSVTINGATFAADTTSPFTDTYIRFGDGTVTSVFHSDNTYQDPANLGVALDVVSGVSAADELALLGVYTQASSGSGASTQLQGLTIGQQYLVQLLIIDNNDQFTGSTGNMHVSSSGSAWGTAYDFTDIGAARLMETTFVADGTTNPFRLGTQGVGRWGVNAFQIRAIPEPISFASLFGFGVLGLLIRKKRKLT